MSALGQELARLRALRGWTLRDVEEKTGKKVSNSYLYQMESGAVKEPSPNILYELSRVYAVPYSDLLMLAGFVVPSSGSQVPTGNASVAFSALNLTQDEMQEVMDFIEFRRRKKKATTG